MSAQITVGDYLLTRLKEIGIDHIFGVPGDYNLGFLDQIVDFQKIKWIGTCNELNGAYASDGYARVKGMASLVTTFGVGELSAINGIAGAYAEYVPIVNIVGLPATTLQEKHALMHHSLGDGEFTVFFDMFKPVTVAQTILSQENATSEIDRVLTECWLKKRPIYIGIPSDVSFQKVNAPEKALPLSYPPSNMDVVKEIVNRCAEIITSAKSPVILLDHCAHTHPMKQYIIELLNKTKIPFANMNMGKGVLNESHPQYIGSYNGGFSSPAVQECVEKSDCIISFGTLLTDFNTGGFTTKINANVTIEIHSYWVNVHQSQYTNVVFQDVIPALTKQLHSYQYKGHIVHPKPESLTFENQPLKHEKLWKLLSTFLDKDAIVLGETGTSLFGAMEMSMPDNTLFIGQSLWASIGYSVGALLGACIAAPHRKVVLFVGDGSFQLTAQELSTVERHGLTPTIFLLDNDGYTVERIIHGPNMAYNDIQHWNYKEFPKIFSNQVWVKEVQTEKELQSVLQERKTHQDKMAFITLKLDKMDAPLALIKISETVAARNKYM